MAGLLGEENQKPATFSEAGFLLLIKES